MESSIKRFIDYSKGIFENLIALHVNFKNKTKTKHFLLMDLREVLSINEYESNRLLNKMLKHD